MTRKQKSSTQMERFFTWCLPIAVTLKTKFVHFSEREKKKDFQILPNSTSKLSRDLNIWRIILH